MVSDRIVLCGGFPSPALAKGQKVVTLGIGSGANNVNLRVSDIGQRTAANMPDVMIDLIEIAAYVYSADQATTRGGEGVLDVGAKWRRNFQFFIPVRQPSVWSHRDVDEVLRSTLGFLSEDTYTFTFRPLSNPTPMEQYLEGTVERREIDQVLLFSGGLDSLGGAVQEVVTNKRRVALVSHRSTPKVDRPQQDLANDLASYCPDNPPLHVPVWANKEKALGIEATQRTRCFLYASLGVAVARMLGLTGLRFYENGITSFNLPISEQLVGARASRTTHPQALNGFAKLFGLLLQEEFRLENPFIWNTKAEVVNLIGAAGCGDLIKHTVSCIHTLDRTKLHTHCGLCSQCVGRRLATLASDFGNADPMEMYKVDLLTGSRDDGPDLTLLESLIRTAREMESMSDRQFFSKFGEASRVINHLPGRANEVGTQILDLHRRYGAEVGHVLTKGMSEHASDIREGRLPQTCAIVLAVHDKYRNRSASDVHEDGSNPEPESGNGRKHLSKKDQHLLEVVGEQLFRTLTNAEIIRRKSMIRSFDPNADTEAVRARLNRIRKHQHFPSSASLRRESVNPKAG